MPTFAVRLHDTKLRSETQVSQLLFHPIQIVANDRRDPGIHDRGAGPEIFTKLRADLGESER